MKHNGKRVLLTGGAGFIGSNLAEALLRSGVELAIVDNLNDFYRPDWKRANLEEVRMAGSYRFVNIDICDPAALRHAVVEFNPEIVIHLAAYAGVRPSIAQPALYERVNVMGTVNLLELCREFKIPRFIFASSSSVYGASSRAPFREDQLELRPISPYAATKLAGEMLAFTYAYLFGITTVCLRFFTVYGPRQRPDLAIHKFTSLIEAGKPIPIYGDGTTGRDYTYVDDIVAGVMASLTYNPAPTNGAAYDIINLGNSHPVSLRELIELLERVTGKQALLDPQSLQPGDAPLTWADISKSSRLLGYQPRTPLLEGLNKFVSWYRSEGKSRRVTCL
jgi:UDP-glucuronate 4-epimerase